MADIDVVPKRRTNVWLWIIVALVVIVGLWMAFGHSNPAATGELLTYPGPALT